MRILKNWASSTAYQKDDLVLDNLGDRYIALKDHISKASQVPGSFDAKGLWELFLKAGIPGKAGKDGKDGTDGEPGASGKDGKDGEPGPRGADGKDGKDGDRGPRGEQGQAGKDGRDSALQWRGQWKNTSSYTIGDIVRVGPGNDGIAGGVYICVKENVKFRPPYPGWELFVPDGVRGQGGSGGGSSNVAKFIDLTDAPHAYMGASHEIVRVKGTEDGVEFHTLAAVDVAYSNGSFTTVQAALDSLLYVNPQITGITNNVGTVEIGQTVTSVHVSWSYNKTMTSASLTDVGSISPSATSHDFTSLSLTSDKTYALSASDGTNTANASTSVLFRRKRYWGASVLTSLSNSDILALSQEFATNFNKAITYDCSGGKYPYLAYPASFGTPSAVTVGGLAFSDFSVNDQSLTNASGHTESYRVLRFNNLQTGSAIAVVWQ